MGFCCKILSLNDLTPSPISRPGTQCLETVSPEGTFCDTVQVPSNGGDMELI